MGRKFTSALYVPLHSVQRRHWNPTSKHTPRAPFLMITHHRQKSWTPVSLHLQPCLKRHQTLTRKIVNHPTLRSLPKTLLIMQTLQRRLQVQSATHPKILRLVNRPASNPLAAAVRAVIFITRLVTILMDIQLIVMLRIVIIVLRILRVIYLILCFLPVSKFTKVLNPEPHFCM